MLRTIPLHAIPSAVILPGWLWHTVTYKNQSKLLDTSAPKEEGPHVQSHHLFHGVFSLPAQLAWRQYVSPLSNNVILSQAAGPHSALSFLLCGFSNSDANSLLNILPPRHVVFFFFSLQPLSTRCAPASGWLRPAPIVHIVIFMSRA